MRTEAACRPSGKADDPQVGLRRTHRTVRRVVQLMGMPISLAIRGRHANTSAGFDAWQSVIKDLSEADRIFSTYRPESVISRFNRGELTMEECPPAVHEVLAIAAAAERQSSGAFSVWLPRPKASARPPVTASTATARQPGPDLNESDLFDTVGPGCRWLDPSGVVKGWAVERASRRLAELADTDYCLAAGGDLICRVRDPISPAWQIGIEDPTQPDQLIGLVPIRCGAVATSGTAHRGEHLLDARTGKAATGVCSVTVIGPSLTWADIDATAAYALGTEAADWLRTRTGQSALVVWPGRRTTIVDGRA